MKQISIDIETYSSVDLKKCGVYKYAEAENFTILLFGYAVDGCEVKVVDLAQGEKIPEEILDGIMDESVEKWAFNASFERICLSRYLGEKYLSPSSLRCSMIWSAYLGLPLSLEGVGAVLKLEEQKMTEGKNLIKYFCTPNNKGCRRMPHDDMEKWEMFKAYNKRDVEVEMSIQGKISRFPVPNFVWNEYNLDQEINDRGIKVDKTLVKNAIVIDARTKDELKEKMQRLTELENPNSVQQLRNWLSDSGIEMESLGKKDVNKKIQEGCSDEISEVLQLRQQLAKSSVKKYQAMDSSACADDRARGMFMFYGANRTGREAGRIIQLQNLPQNHLPDMDEARELVRQGNVEVLQMLYDDIPDTLSQLIRSAFIPSDGNLFFVADFSAIEARVLSWLAGEQWVLDAFAEGRDIYSITASRMYGVPVEKHGANKELRQRGKVAILACGYGGSVGAMKAFGAPGTDEELQEQVNYWRAANPNIVSFWWAVDRAVKTAVKDRTTTHVKNLTFSYQSGFLFITLPSGRRLSYVKPRIGENKFGGESVTYEGTGGTKKWERLESYGPKFVENIVQAISRDILFHAIKSLSDYSIVAHVHDEIILEAPPETSIDEVCKKMAELPAWTEGLVLSADGYTTPWYKKD